MCLAAWQGNLSEFVKIRPEAKAYYELGSASLKFILPKPGFLDGIKGREVGRHATSCVMLHDRAAPGIAGTRSPGAVSACTFHMRRDLLYPLPFVPMKWFSTAKQQS